MVRVRIDLDGDGCLRGLEAVGHAGSGRRGENLTCAAVSGLLRSVARLLHGTDGLVVAGQAPGPGRLALEVVRTTPERRVWLRGVTDVLLSGLRDLGEEQAGSIELKIGKEGKEEH